MLSKEKVIEVVQDLQFAIAAEGRVQDGKKTKLIQRWERELDMLTQLVWAVANGEKFTAQCYFDELDKHSQNRLAEAGVKRWLEES